MLRLGSLLSVAPIFILLTLSLSTPVAGGHDLVSATLDGRRISVREVPNLHCHDANYPDLSCFASEEERDNDFASGSIGSLLAGSNGYVVAYIHATYAGSSVILSVDRDNLSSIGWNDKISSYKVYATQTGYFAEHAYLGGRLQSFCCYTNVPYVGDALNDRFSSYDNP